LSWDFSLSFPILWCNHIGDHPQEELARFGYRSERKVENLKNLVIDFGMCWNILCKNGDFTIFSLKSGNFGALFSQKSFAWVALYFLLLLSDKNLPQNQKKKKKTCKLSSQGCWAVWKVQKTLAMLKVKGTSFLVWKGITIFYGAGGYSYTLCIGEGTTVSAFWPMHQGLSPRVQGRMPSLSQKTTETSH
jgi:hypothetical protein